MPEAPHSRLRRVVGLVATEAEVVVARPVSTSPRFVKQCRVSLATRYGFSDWRTDSSIMRRIAVAGPVAGETVWILLDT